MTGLLPSAKIRGNAKVIARAFARDIKCFSIKTKSFMSMFKSKHEVEKADENVKLGQVGKVIGDIRKSEQEIKYVHFSAFHNPSPCSELLCFDLGYVMHFISSILKHKSFNP